MDQEDLEKTRKFEEEDNSVKNEDENLETSINGGHIKVWFRYPVVDIDSNIKVPYLGRLFIY